MAERSHVLGRVALELLDSEREDLLRDHIGCLTPEKDRVGSCFAFSEEAPAVSPVGVDGDADAPMPDDYDHGPTYEG